MEKEEEDLEEKEKMEDGKKDILLKLKNSLYNINIFENLDLNMIYEILIDSNDFENIFDYIDKEIETNENLKFKEKINIIKKNIRNNIKLKNINKSNKIEVKDILNKKENKNISYIENDNKSKDLIIEQDSKNKEIIKNENNNILCNNNIHIDKKFQNINKIENIQNNKDSNKELNDINIILYNQEQNDENKDKEKKLNDNEDNSNIKMKINLQKEKLSIKEKRNFENDNNSNESNLINSINSIKLNKIIEYVNYPEMKDLKKNLGEKTEKLDNVNMRKLLRAFHISNLLREKIKYFTHNLLNSAFKIENYIEKINIEIELKKLEIENSSLEIFIEFIQNPYYLILKRKIIEVFLFNLYKSQKDKFKLPENYLPDKTHLEELEKLIEEKEDKSENIDINKIKKDKAIINNYKTLINQKNKGFKTELIENKDKDILLNQNIFDKQYLIIEDFLEFYRKRLNLIIDDTDNSYDKTNYYFISDLSKRKRKDDNQETNFFSDVGSISYNDIKKEIKNNNNNIDIKLNNKIYNINKILPKDFAIEFIFSEDSLVNYLNDNFIKSLYLNNDQFKDELSKINKLAKYIFQIDFFCDKITINKEDIKEIEKMTKHFYQEVIIPIDNFYNSLIIKNKIDSNDEKFFIEIKAFLEKYLKNCNNFAIEWEELSDLNGIYYLYAVETKLVNLEAIESIINDKYKKINEIIEKKRLELYEGIKKAHKRIEFLKNMLNNQKLKNGFELYKNWINNSKNKYIKDFEDYKSFFSVENIKKILKAIIKGDTMNINIEINFSFDKNFYLWAINNNLEEYLI